jgi:hypothetical protein
MTKPPPDTDELGTAFRAAMAGVRAPERVHARVEAERSARRRSRPLRYPAVALAGAAGTLALAFAAVLAIGLIGGEATRLEGPSLAQAATLALRANNGPRPAEDEINPIQVRAGIDGLRFPYWDDAFGLDAVAMRRDRLGVRPAMTVEYRGKGERVGYTIVAGPPLRLPSQVQHLRRGRLALTVHRDSGATIVTWRRAGHTCVLASRNAGTRRLLHLAAWTGGGAVGGYR